MNVATLQVSGSLESKFNYHFDVALYYFVCFGASSRGRNSVLPALEVKSRSGHCQTEKEEQFYILTALLFFFQSSDRSMPKLINSTDSAMPAKT